MPNKQVQQALRDARERALALNEPNPHRAAQRGFHLLRGSTSGQP